MQSRKAFLSVVLSGLVAASLVGPGQVSAETVDELLAADARTAAANEEIKAVKAERTAREAAGLPPPGASLSPPKVAREKVFELVSIFGVTGQRNVRFTVDGVPIDLSESGGANNGYALVGIDGTCARVAAVSGSATKKAAHKSKVISAGKPTNVCYVAATILTAQNVLRPNLAGVGGSLPPPVSLGMLPPVPVVAPQAGGSVPTSIQLPSGGSLPVATPTR